MTVVFEIRGGPHDGWYVKFDVPDFCAMGHLTCGETEYAIVEFDRYALTGVISPKAEDAVA